MPDADLAPSWKENSTRGILAEKPWRTLWAARELVVYLGMRDLKVRYRQAVLGALWVLVLPAVSVAIFTAIFRRLVGVHGLGVPYPLFALVGMVTWTFFSSATVAASASLVGNADLVTKVYFPRMAAPAAALLRPMVDFALSMGLVLVLAVYYHVFPGVRLITLPLWLALLALTAFGPSLWLSALNVRYRDVQHVVAPVLQIGLLVSPVAYPAGLLAGWQEWIYALNPMVGVIELGRWTMLGTPWPGWPLLVSCSVGTFVLLGGMAYFHRAQRSFADVI